MSNFITFTILDLIISYIYIYVWNIGQKNFANKKINLELCEEENKSFLSGIKFYTIALILFIFKLLV